MRSGKRMVLTAVGWIGACGVAGAQVPKDDVPKDNPPKEVPAVRLVDEVILGFEARLLWFGKIRNQR